MKRREDGMVICESLAEIKWYVRECAARLMWEIAFVYDSASAEIMKEGRFLTMLLAGSGILHWSCTLWEGKREIRFDRVVYFQGFRIIQARRRNRLDILTPEEKGTLKKAVRLVEQARSEAKTGMELERKLFDAVCQNAYYGHEKRDRKEEQGWASHSTAVGALRYGAAVCAGYTDAFYLLGTLAGLQIGFVSGSTPDAAENEGHIWNCIRLNGKWYHVDVTWGDMNNENAPEMTQYRYFNVGSDFMTDHIWREDLTQQVIERRTDWHRFFYTCGEEGFGRYFEKPEQAARYLAGQAKKGDSPAHAMVRGEFETADEFQKLMSQALTDAGWYGRWTTYLKKLPGYTCFDVLFNGG